MTISQNNHPVNRDEIQRINGFHNGTNIVFSEKEQELLNKGPSYVPPIRKCTESINIKFKAELQACHERMSGKNANIAQSAPFTELLCGIDRITQSAQSKIKRENGNNIWNVIDSIKEKNILIVPTDKSKRLIALEQQKSDQLLSQALGDTGAKSKPVLPSTRQSVINRKIQ